MTNTSTQEPCRLRECLASKIMPAPIRSHRSFILLLLAVVSTAFVPAPSHVSVFSSAHGKRCDRDVAVVGGRRRSPSSPLFMNKKKKKRPLTKNARGFGAGASSSSSSLTGGTTLIQPKTTPNFPYAGSIRPGLQTPKRTVPGEDGRIKFPDYALDGVPKNRPTLFPWVIEVKKPDEIEKMRASGRCAREVLDLAGRLVQPGITT